MSREKQIEEIAVIVSNSILQWANELPPISNPHFVANAIYNAGYRKQSVGEWKTIQETKTDIITECTACKKQFWFMKKGQLNIDRMPYCPNCGAKMKGGAE